MTVSELILALENCDCVDKNNTEVLFDHHGKLSFLSPNVRYNLNCATTILFFESKLSKEDYRRYT